MLKYILKLFDVRQSLKLEYKMTNDNITIMYSWFAGKC